MYEVKEHMHVKDTHQIQDPGYFYSGKEYEWTFYYTSSIEF